MRTRSHVLENESFVAFQQALGDDLLFHDMSKHDYGIDGEVEVFEGESATGVRFFAQLKATDEQVLRKALKRRIKLTTANYWRSQTVPTLVVLYHAPTGKIYAKWFHRFDPHYDHVGDTHLTFNWDEQDVWSDSSPARFASEADRVIKAKSAKLQPPLSLRLSVESPVVQGITRTDLKVAVEEAVFEMPDLLFLSAEDDAMLQLSVSDEAVVADFAGVGMYLHFDDEGRDDLPEPQFVADLFIAAAISLARVGHSDMAARLAALHASDSLLASIAPANVELAMALAQTQRIDDALDLAQRFLEAEDASSPANALVYVFALIQQPLNLDADEIERISGLLESQYESAIDSDPELASDMAVLNGSLMSKVGRQGDAADWLSKAAAVNEELREDPDYLARLAGARFLSGSPADAAEIYAQAIGNYEGESPDLISRHADALMLAGDYEAALREFQSIETDDAELAAWIYTKSRALHFILSRYEIPSQDREFYMAARESERLMNDSLTDDERGAIMDDVVKHDAISPGGWFNFGVNANRAAQHELAMHAFLVSASSFERDVEAWVNVAHLALIVGDLDLLASSVLTGSRLNSHAYFKEFSSQLKKRGMPAGAREEILASIQELADPRSHDASSDEEGEVESNHQ